MKKQPNEEKDGNIYQVWSNIGYYCDEVGAKNARRAMQEAVGYSRGRAWVVDSDGHTVFEASYRMSNKQADEDFDVMSMEM